MNKFSKGDRINDLALLGTSKLILLKSKLDGDNCEVEDIKTSGKTNIAIENITEYI